MSDQTSTFAEQVRATADGEHLGDTPAHAEGVKFERDLRASVGRVMHESAPVPPDLRFRTLTAVAERLASEAAPLNRFPRRAARLRMPNASQRRTLIFRSSFAAAFLGLGVLLGASFHWLPAPHPFSEASLPMVPEISQALRLAFASKNSSTTPLTISEAAAAGRKITGSAILLPATLPDFLTIYRAGARTRGEFSSFEVHFGVTPRGSHDPGERDDVLVLIRRGNFDEFQSLAHHRLYSILGTNLILHAYRDGDLIYYFAADAKSALIRVEQLMGIDTSLFDNERGSTIIDLNELDKLRLRR